MVDTEIVRENCLSGFPCTGGYADAEPLLIELYTATNKPDEVKKWQAERAKYPEPKKDTEKK